MTLRTNQNKAIAALLANKTAKDAALVAGVGYRTLNRWLTEDQAFIDALRSAEDQLINQAAMRLLALNELAINTLEDIARRAESETARRLAADSILTHTLKLIELRNLTDRIAALEKKIDAK